MNSEESLYLDKIIAYYKSDVGTDQISLLECLKSIQVEFKQIPNEAIERCAIAFNTQIAVVKALIQRTAQLKQESKTHVITMCNGERCQARQAYRFIASIEEYLKIKVGQTTPDKRFELRTQHCLHRCAMGKNVNLDDQELTEMTYEKLIAELQKINT